MQNQPTEKIEKHPLQIRDCGIADYAEILELQLQLYRQRLQGEIPNTALIVEHPPVITLGARQSLNKLRVSREDLTRQDIDVVEIRRGGGATAHNRGQLVCYPILNLQQLGLDISEYIRALEAIGIELLRKTGVDSARRKGAPGLWVDERKIASVGVRAPKLVTYHGIAINIRNDLSIFESIVPCGLDNVEMTSAQKETGEDHSMKQAKRDLAVLLGTAFRYGPEVTRELIDKSRSRTGKSRKLPPWMHRRLPPKESLQPTEKALSSLGLETICSNANCPNLGECWERGTATVLILGNICMRNCRFCSVAAGKPKPPDPDEPSRLALMVERMKLKYLVITSVNRDDLPDGGAGHFRDCIDKARTQCPDVKFEILTPDFRDCQRRAIETLGQCVPFVFAHNVETVPSLYRTARAGGDYQQSLNLLRMAKDSYGDINTKSSIMLGLGETDAEVRQVLKDLRSVGCDRITIGQYLKPSKNSLEVVEYITPARFDEWKQEALELGFSWIISSPFARSSYFAEQDEMQ